MLTSPAGIFDATVVRVCTALNEIGIATTFVEKACGFLENVRIVNGTLHIAPECDASDVLHEAGHLSIIPSRYRSRANDDLDVLTKFMLEDLDLVNGDEPDSPLYRAVIQCSDPEATAWAWAFGKHLGLPEEEIIKDDQYPDENGVPTGAEVRMCLAMRAYVGINGLAHAGFCSVNRFGRLPVYPKLAYWTQEL
ncbi:hypothetical protein F6X40_17515 [Paraburkholderia sp. UCT31]|uniref:hypothetical protein n=1 Tax=Paraburkholderia sp. UCT31 TaxID=2615209 RepID=UPI0016563A42|nr:hypothetical protein [Paraburkholderia sp. UCT31]MBC8738559.1 hypothetical protein [Paraburkholderia sp. UCT31]